MTSHVLIRCILRYFQPIVPIGDCKDGPVTSLCEFSNGIRNNGFTFAFTLCLPFIVMMGVSGRGLAPAPFAAIALGAATIIGLVSGLAEALLDAPPTRDVD